MPAQVSKLVVSFAEIPGIRDKLPQMAQQLDVCQRALSEFLEDKRSSFPRCGRCWLAAPHQCYSRVIAALPYLYVCLT